MTVRETSAAVYHEIEAKGLLSAMRWKVYSFLYQFGPLTQNELNAGLKGSDEVAPSYHKRLSELRDLKVVRELGTRTCKVSGNQCIEWDVTALLPEDQAQGAVRPTVAEMRKALDDLRDLYRKLGKEFSPELMKLCGWLAAKTK